jgi:hypothetical protein
MLSASARKVFSLALVSLVVVITSLLDYVVAATIRLLQPNSRLVLVVGAQLRVAVVGTPSSS